MSNTYHILQYFDRKKYQINLYLSINNEDLVRKAYFHYFRRQPSIYYDELPLGYSTITFQLGLNDASEIAIIVFEFSSNTVIDNCLRTDLDSFLIFLSKRKPLHELFCGKVKIGTFDPTNSIKNKF